MDETQQQAVAPPSPPPPPPRECMACLLESDQTLGPHGFPVLKCGHAPCCFSCALEVWAVHPRCLVCNAAAPYERDIVIPRKNSAPPTPAVAPPRPPAFPCCCLM